MANVAETLSVETKRTGAGVAYRSGLENQAGKARETAEMAGFCAELDTPDTLFADCSAGRDGAYVGTWEIE